MPLIGRRVVLVETSQRALSNVFNMEQTQMC
jgi:hypothetical protein